MSNVSSLAQNGPSENSGSSRALAERALRAIATSQDLRARYEQLQGRLVDAIGWREQLREQSGDLRRELRSCVASVAREERALGHSAAQVVELLHEIVNSAGLDRSNKQELQTQVLEWGIGEYYAA